MGAARGADRPERRQLRGSHERWRSPSSGRYRVTTVTISYSSFWHRRDRFLVRGFLHRGLNYSARGRGPSSTAEKRRRVIGRRAAHLPAALRATTAFLGAIIHVANLLAALGAGIAYFSAHRANANMQFRAAQHEIRRSATDLRSRMMGEFEVAEIQTGETTLFVRWSGCGLPILLLHAKARGERE